LGQFFFVVAVRGIFLSAPYPSDTMVEIKALYTQEEMILIEAIAVLDAQKQG
jgi:hypothetical protein